MEPRRGSRVVGGRSVLDVRWRADPTRARQAARKLCRALLAPVFAYVGEILRRVDLEQQTQLARRAATQRQSAEVRARLELWDSENAPLIEFVTPALTDLAAGLVVTPDVARDYRAREACCRDYLRSPGFVDRHLLSVSFEARERGCDIVLDLSEPPIEPELGALRMAVSDALATAGVTALNLTRIPGASTTLVIKGSESGLKAAAGSVTQRLARDAALDSTCTFLGTAVLLEIAR